MRYNNNDGKEDVREWLGSRPENYDFVEDTQKKYSENFDFGKIKNPYEKFFIYKFNTEEKNKKPKWNVLDRVEDEILKTKFKDGRDRLLGEAKKYIIGDPDSASDMLQEIYKILWPDLAEKEFMKQGDKIASDTMTSAMVRFTGAMKVIIGDNCNEETPDEYADILKQISAVHTACGERQHWWSQNFSIIVAAVLGNEFYELINDKYYCMPCFLDKIHTIGNYCPVPAGFNGARSAFGEYDYWDLTLQKIYEWYCTYDELECDGKIDIGRIDNLRDNLIQKDLMHGMGYELTCVRWLETFGKGKIGWRNFVNYLHMQDYVMDAENGDYRPRLFWKEHSWEHPEIFYIENCKDKKRKIEIINEHLQEITTRIAARSIRIVNACRKIIGEKMEIVESPEGKRI